MNRQEDFDRQADDYSNCCFEEDDSLFAAFHFKEGAEYGYKYAIEKVCEWLEQYAANFVALPDEGQQPIGDTNAIYGTKSLLYYLRKEMEE